MKPTNGRWWPEKAPWEGGGRVPCRRGKEGQDSRHSSRLRLRQQETPWNRRDNLFLLRHEPRRTTWPDPSQSQLPQVLGCGFQGLLDVLFWLTGSPGQMTFVRYVTSEQENQPGEP